jgi:thiosulfate/3-mercaptopyruvate sulfurtransferase
MALLILLLLAFFTVSGQSTSGTSAVSVAVEASTPTTAATYAHPEWLVDGAWLQAHIGASSGVRVIALTPAEDFAKGHIPGAAQVDWPELSIVETSDQSVATWRAAVEERLTALGVTRDETVVIYDGGTLYAPRLWWILDQLGHEDKRILNGGLQAWTDAGGALESGPSTVQPAATPYVGVPNEDAIETIAEVQTAVGDPNTVLVDARSASEYEAGHIPGAVNIEFTENAVGGGSTEWKSAADLLAMYEAVGATPDKTVIAYCSTGVRSAAVYFTLRLLGYEHVMLFTGSFKEWSAIPGLPITTGDHP